ncbi:MAG: hypothetical protein ACRD07_08160 [Acidimicrobiales bacterium]
MYLDESKLVWAAALVEDVDPAELLARVDVAALVTIVAGADEAIGPIDAAARLLVRVVRDRPFLTGNAAIGWLAGDYRVEPRRQVLARGACGSFLLPGDRTNVVVSPFCDDPPIVRVVEVDEVRPGDLVGRWDRLVERSSTLGFVPADEARPDESGWVDLGRLRRALRDSGPHGAVAAGGDVAPCPVGML